MFYFKVLITFIYLAFPRLCSSLATTVKPAVELSAFFMTVVAAGTGIMVFQGETGCFYLIEKSATSPDYNPALNYKFMPTGCQISNGMSVVVLTSALFTFYAVMLRYELAEIPTASTTNSCQLHEKEEHKSDKGESIRKEVDHAEAQVRSAVVL